MTNIARALHESISLREAQKMDLGAMLELLAELQSEETFEQSGASRAMWDSLLSREGLFCFLAESQTEVLGTTTLAVIPNLTRGCRPFGVIQNVVTRKEVRGSGIGRMLMAHTLEVAWKQQCYQVLVQTGRPEVVSWYEAQGFKQGKTGLMIKPEW